MEEAGGAVDEVMIFLSAFCFQRMITMVSGKMIWTSDDDLANHDVILAYFNGQFMVCKVGKYIIFSKKNGIYYQYLFQYFSM